MAESRFRSEQLRPEHKRATFTCGIEPLDRYFRQQASQDQRRKIATPYVVVDVSTGEIAGFYTLSAHSVVGPSLPEEITRKLPRYPTLPAFLIGRLGLATSHQRQGLGRVLLYDALHRCLSLSESVGALGVVVDAKVDAARAFYEHIGFLPFPDTPDRLFIPLAAIAGLVGA